VKDDNGDCVQGGGQKYTYTANTPLADLCTTGSGFLMYLAIAMFKGPSAVLVAEYNVYMD